MVKYSKFASISENFLNMITKEKTFLAIDVHIF